MGLMWWEPVLSHFVLFYVDICIYFVAVYRSCTFHCLAFQLKNTTRYEYFFFILWTSLRHKTWNGFQPWMERWGEKHEQSAWNNALTLVQLCITQTKQRRTFESLFFSLYSGNRFHCVHMSSWLPWYRVHIVCTIHYLSFDPFGEIGHC